MTDVTWCWVHRVRLFIWCSQLNCNLKENWNSKREIPWNWNYKEAKNRYIFFVLTIQITAYSVFPPCKELNFAQSVCLVRFSYKTSVVSLNSNGRQGFVKETACFVWGSDWNFMMLMWKAFVMNTFKLSLTKQFFMTHKIRQTDISASLDS